VNWKQIVTLTILALYGIFTIGRFIPGFGSALRSIPIPHVIGVAVVVAWLVFLNGVTAYQLWTGKASTWDWEAPQKGYQGWIHRSQHPFSYWFRVLLFLAIALFFDFAAILFLADKIRTH
jgi:hypothetical protein